MWLFDILVGFQKYVERIWSRLVITHHHAHVFNIYIIRFGFVGLFIVLKLKD